MNLYFVHSEDANDEMNWDLLVWANSVDEAVVLWREYYWPDDMASQSEDAQMFPKMAFIVPTAKPSKPQAVAWHKDMSEIPIPTKIAAEAFGLKQGALS